MASAQAQARELKQDAQKKALSDGNTENGDTENAVEQWKIKRLIKTLEEARGNGTSMISLIIPPKDQISRVAKMLADEQGTATNIKSRVNRLSVLGAISSVQARLKLYSKVPKNGLVIYCGSIVTEEGKEKKVSIDFEPFRPINTSLYLCDNKFHTEALKELLESDDKFGFIVMDGNGTLFGTLSGSTRTILHKFSVELPKKHGRGGQSALRFARLRLEKRHNYVRKVAELATSIFITNDKPNVCGLVLAGSAEFKQKLHVSDLFDPRLNAIVEKVVDVSYGGENGFNQAIELAADSLKNVKLVREKKLLASYFSQISLDSRKFCFGVKDTLTALESGGVCDLIVWENLDTMRYTFRTAEGQQIIKDMSAEEEKKTSNFHDEAGVEMDILEKQPLLEYLSQNYKNFGCNLHFVTDRSQEGSQFCKGFGGIGGLLRYEMDFANFEEPEEGGGDDDDAEDDLEDLEDFFSGMAANKTDTFQALSQLGGCVCQEGVHASDGEAAQLLLPANTKMPLQTDSHLLIFDKIYRNDRQSWDDKKYTWTTQHPRGHVLYNISHDPDLAGYDVDPIDLPVVAPVKAQHLACGAEELELELEPSAQPPSLWYGRSALPTFNHQNYNNYRDLSTVWLAHGLSRCSRPNALATEDDIGIKAGSSAPLPKQRDKDKITARA
eukprot:g67960.t1